MRTPVETAIVSRTIALLALPAGAAPPPKRRRAE